MHSIDKSIGGLTFGDVQVEEITIQHGLHKSSHHSNDVKAALIVVSVDPVQYVEASIRAQGKQVMAGDRLRFSSLGDHK